MTNSFHHSINGQSHNVENNKDVLNIAIVCVCYNAHADAIRLLNSIELAYESLSLPINLSVVLSDNSSLKVPIELINKKYPFEFKYLKNKNIGYFPAFNSGIEILKRDCSSFDYIAVSNVDLELDESFFVSLQEYTISQDVGVIGPRIRSLVNGRDLNPKMMLRPSVKKVKFNRFLFTYTFLFNGYNFLLRLKEFITSKTRADNKQESISSASNNTEMYGAHGSFIIFTKNYFIKGASTEYPRFLFGEEGFVAEQARKHKLKVIHLPQIIIHDQEHGTTSQQPSEFMCREHVKSYDYYLNNFRKD